MNILDEARSSMNSLEQAIADLRKVVETNPNRDRFPVGTVIRWTASGRYTYVAVKTEVAWFTTARPGNPFVPSNLDYKELQEILGRSETTDIAVATAWAGLDGSSVPDPGLPFTNMIGGALYPERINDASPAFRKGRGLVSGSRAGLYDNAVPEGDSDVEFEDQFPGHSGESI